MSDAERIVIVGASLTGARAAEGARDAGFEGEILLIGDEPELPYERPPLSKDYLQGKRDDLAWVHDESFYAENRIDLRTSTHVSGIDPAARVVLIEGADPEPYDRLLLSTGAEPRRIEIPGADLDGIHYLRSVADSAKLRDLFGEGIRVVVVGAGWIGSEVAASAREKGCEVTVVEPQEVPLEKVLGTEIGGVYRDVHLEHGVDFKGGTGVEAFLGDGKVEKVRTTAGEVAADLVVVGIGVVPRTGLAEMVGLELNNGVPVDAGLRTEAERIYAAGDIANQFHPFYGDRIRVEHWANARRQGFAAGRSIAGAEVVYDDLPYFYSDQYDVGMEYVGYATDWDEVVVRGDKEAREFIAFWLKQGQIQAGMNVNIWDVSETIGELIKSRRAIDPAALADPERDLASL
jgi:3-phenylpropionate/trans-cinnamate dioxygenase ferredoxin reductase subunit